MIEWIYATIANNIEEWALSGDYNASIVAKNLWANFWWSDKSEHLEKKELKLTLEVQTQRFDLMKQRILESRQKILEYKDKDESNVL